VPAARAERAPAKVNLTLRVLGRRPDGYHELESLVVFAAVSDTLAFRAGRGPTLALRGPTADAVGEVTENLVLKAVRALAAQIDGLKLGHFVLSKRLPVAAGLGGGSADAAAALRLVARANRIAPDDPRLMQAARATGADVPVCLDPRPRLMRGIGEILSEPLDLPSLPAVLVNPGVAVATKDIFAKFNAPAFDRAAKGKVAEISRIPRGRKELLDYLATQTNDLEGPAIAIAPAIADVLAALGASKDCRLAHMSGSGATCFGLFDSRRAAAAAALALRNKHRKWWVRATILQ